MGQRGCPWTMAALGGAPRTAGYGRGDQAQALANAHVREGLPVFDQWR